MKKFISILLLIMIMIQPIATFAHQEECVENSAELLYTLKTNYHQVPYEPTYTFIFTNGWFRVSTIQELYRLLELTKMACKSYVNIKAPESLVPEMTSIIEEFFTENADKCWSTPSCRADGGDIRITLNWNSSKNNYIPVLKNAEDVYNAVLYAKKYPTYEKAYRIDETYFSKDDYYDSYDGFNYNLNKITDEVKEKYGEDITSYIQDFDYDRNMISSWWLFYVGIGASKKDNSFDDEDEERYFRILKNSVVLPIEDDMSDIDKIRIIAATVGRIMVAHTDSIKSGSFFEVDNRRLTAVSEGFGICTQFATLFYDLCDLYGIEAIYVTGKVDWAVEGHAWNGVKCDGKWYLLEPQSVAYSSLYPPDVDYLSLYLYGRDQFIAAGYHWKEEDFPEFSDTNLIVNGEKFSLNPNDMPDTVKKYQLIEPYYAPDPIAGRSFEIHHDVYFDKTNGKIYAFDTNLPSDYCYKGEDGMYYTKPKPDLVIPEEIDGVKVKSIAFHMSGYFSIPQFSKIIIPDDIVIENFAFLNVRTGTLELGNNVVAGYNSLPSYSDIVLGDNVVYKGVSSQAGGGTKMTYKNMYGFEDGAYIYYNDKKVTDTPEGITRLYYGCGNDIIEIDTEDILNINEYITWIDPRLNRLNKNYVVDEANPYYTSVDGVLYSKDMTKLLSVPVGKSTVEIPDTVTEIGEFAFSFCNEIEKITIPATVKNVGDRAFWHLSNIKKIYLEGDRPEGFETLMCSEHEVNSINGDSSVRIDYNLAGKYIRINNVPVGTKCYVAFYDVNDMLFVVKEGNKVEIPYNARSYEIYIWGANNRPYTYKEGGRL